VKRSRSFPKLAAVVCIGSIALGMFGEGFVEGNAAPAELRWWTLAGFIFFVGASALGALLEKVVRKSGTGLQRVVSRDAAPVAVSSNRPWQYYGYGGLFSVGLGFGMLASAAWRDFIFAWYGLAFLGAGAGLMVGRKLALRILNS
jgi:hypothetical protein